VSPFLVSGTPAPPTRGATQVINDGFVTEPIASLAGERQSVARVDVEHGRPPIGYSVSVRC